MAGHLFLVGLPRTGSTLLRHVLNQSPSISIAPETHFMARARRLGLDRRLAATLRGDARDDLRSVLTDVHSAAFWPWLARNTTLDELDAQLRPTRRTLRDLFDVLLRLYAARANAEMPAEALVLGEKSPEHLSSVPTLGRWYPEAKFIHTIRDPRAVYASRLRRAQKGHWGLKARLPRVSARLLDPLLPPTEAAYAIRNWNTAARLHRRYLATLGSRYTMVRFEDLVTEPEAVLRRLCTFVGIEFMPDMLTSTDIVGSSFEERRHAGAGFDPSVVDRWRQEVHPGVASLIAIGTRRQRNWLGYED